MPGAYAAAKGAALVALIHEIRDAFLAGPAIMATDPKLPNSLRLVSLETFAKKTKHDKLEILGDLMEADVDLPIEREASEIFSEAGTAGAYLEDLVCDIACQVLYADIYIRTEDENRHQATGN